MTNGLNLPLHCLPTTEIQDVFDDEICSSKIVFDLWGQWGHITSKWNTVSVILDNPRGVKHHHHDKWLEFAAAFATYHEDLKDVLGDEICSSSFVFDLRGQWGHFITTTTKITYKQQIVIFEKCIMYCWSFVTYLQVQDKHVQYSKCKVPVSWKCWIKSRKIVKCNVWMNRYKCVHVWMDYIRKKV